MAMDRNISLSKLFVACAVVTWLICATATFNFEPNKPYNPKYGYCFNEERDRIGLSEFDSTWTLYLDKWDDDYDNPNTVNYYKNILLWSYEGFDTILADPKTFICGRAYEEIWINPNASSTSPCHYSKNIIYDKDTTIFIERDVYWSGNTFKTIESDGVEESLTAEYYFRENKWYYKWEKNNGWIAASWPKSGFGIRIEDYEGDVGPDTWYSGTECVVITKRVADSLLELWGVMK